MSLSNFSDYVERISRRIDLTRLKKLNILLTNVHLTQQGGTEQWILIMATTLRQLGHNVIVYSPRIGPFGERYIAPVSILVDKPPRNGIDLLLINHNTCLEQVSGMSGIKIFTSHSTFLEVERCVPGADMYVAVSEHIQQIEKKRGFDCHVIYNPIDATRFTPTSAVHSNIRTIFVRVTHDSEEGKYLRRVLRGRGIKLLTLAEKTEHLADYYNKADLVVAIGRELVEAMLCERNVLSMDVRGYIPHYGGAGMITANNFEKLKPYWFSGRENPIPFDQKELFLSELDAYDPRQGKKLRKLATRHFHPRKIALQYLYLYVAQRRYLSRKIYHSSGEKKTTTEIL